MNSISKIEKLLINDNYKEALLVMKSICNENKFKEQENVIFLLLARLEAINKKIQAGVVDYSNNEINEIRYESTKLFLNEIRELLEKPITKREIIDKNPEKRIKRRLLENLENSFLEKFSSSQNGWKIEKKRFSSWR